MQIVTSCLKAVAKIYAMGKNPDAHLTSSIDSSFIRAQRDQWDKRVLLLYGDIWTIDVPESAAIIV
ncbi:hypothetical protein BOTBODRAFT_32841, partial [Botryobasidium botryosum FD-172 SS1]